MAKKDTTIIVMIPSDMKKQIDGFCKEFDVSISHLVRRAVQKELKTWHK